MTSSVRFLAAVLLLTVATLVPQSAQAAPLCFDVPGITDCVDGRFRLYWEQQGGLAVFGYPTSPAHPEQTNEGTFVTQYFERNRFELHPDQPAPYDVQLGRLGDVRLQQQGRDWFTFPKAAPEAEPFFPATGHAIAHAPFWTFWSQHGLEFDGSPGFSEAESLALFGLPFSEPQMETTTTGQQVLTQWFERARFEDHGADGVLLGLLGNETRSTPSTPTPLPPIPPSPDPVVPAPACATPSPSVSGTISPLCVFGGELLTGVATGFKPGEVVGFFVTGPDNSVFDFPVYQGDAVVDASGAYHLQGALSRHALAGVYAITLKGDDSQHVAVLSFALKPQDLRAGPPFDFSEIPAGLHARAIPNSGKRGTRFKFEVNGSGIINEHAGVYATLPDGEVLGAPFMVKVDASGTMDPTLRFISSQDLPVGIIAVTFEGQKTGKKAFAYFRLLP